MRDEVGEWMEEAERKLALFLQEHRCKFARDGQITFVYENGEYRLAEPGEPVHGVEL